MRPARCKARLYRRGTYPWHARPFRPDPINFFLRHLLLEQIFFKSLVPPSKLGGGAFLVRDPRSSAVVLRSMARQEAVGPDMAPWDLV